MFVMRRKKPKVNVNNLKKTKSVLVISEEEARTPLLSGQRQVSELDAQLENGTIQPTDYAEAANKIKQTMEAAKEKEYAPSYQFSPKNSDVEDSVSTVESVKGKPIFCICLWCRGKQESQSLLLAPSQDPEGGWCKTPIRFNGGMFYFKPAMENNGKNFKLECGWEKTIDGTLEKITWVVEGKPNQQCAVFRCCLTELSEGVAGEFALLYDAILNSKKLSKIKGIPEFPHWKSDVYNKGKKGAIGKLFSRADREKKVMFLATCMVELKLREEPGLIGTWLEEVFKVLYGNTYQPKKLEDSNIFFTPEIQHLLDTGVYCMDDIFA